MYVLGINSAYHESSACIVEGGRVIAAAEEERFSRRKHAKLSSIETPHELPVAAIRFCLRAAGIEAADVGRVGYSLNPAKRLKNAEFHDRVAQDGWGSPRGEARFFENLRKVPAAIEELGLRTPEFLDHHVCHAASAFYPSPFERAAVLSIDGIGETGSTLLALGEGRKLQCLREIEYPASLGFLWEKFAKFLGFGEYDACKVMGLAAYGDPARFRDRMHQLVVAGHGAFGIDGDALCFRVEDYSRLEEQFGVAKRDRGSPLAKEHEDVAAALQWVTNEVVLHLAARLAEETGARDLCLAGGVALNCVANRAVIDAGKFDRVFVQPAAHDAGTALGAALLLAHQAGDVAREPMAHAYLGPSFSDAEIEQAVRGSGLSFQRIPEIEDRVAELVANGAIVGWFQGAMEFGPRALGNRSLLADPRNPNVRELLNEKVKHREPFRPFGPSVLAESASTWFDVPKFASAAEYMLLVCPVRSAVRAQIPAITHVDGSSRIQLVRRETNPRYHALIRAFAQRTGVPLVLNTSFNDDEPIVCDPHHALDTLRKTRIDYVALGSFLVRGSGRTA